MLSAAGLEKDSTNAERCGGDSKISEARVTRSPKKGASTLRESSIAAVSNNSFKNKPKRKVQTVRSTKSSREASPTRSVVSAAGTKAPQNTTSASASYPDLEQPHLQRPHSNAPHWPNSPRLSRTPPPDSRSPASSPRKKSDSTVPAAAPTITLLREGSDHLENPDEPSIQAGMRTPRSNSSTALETVVESSLPSTPAIGTSKILAEQVAALVARQPSKIPEEEDKFKGQPNKTTRKTRTGSVTSSITPKSEVASESESGYRSDDKTPASTSNKIPQKGFTRRPTVMGKDMASRGMTVETETVSSVPQVALGAVGPPGGASIRSKKSTDTIRAPKKDKRRSTRRTVVSGTSNASSKADIFAAKIAEAVDEANSSDSEETFVYESNPPESVQRPSSRFHSRTPSATSIGPDPRGQRLPILSTIDGTQSTGRKGMKFVNNSLNKDSGNIGGDGVTGDISLADRNIGSSNLLPHRERHVGRNHNSHRSILTDDNLFHRPTTQNSLVSSRHSSRPPSPKLPYRNGGNGVVPKKPSRIWASYEADVEGADDEHAPLIRPRVHRNRRPGSGSLRQLEHSQLRRRGCVRAYAGCIVAMVTIIMILTGVGGFLVSTTNALLGVKIVNVTDVLVSKQEIMLDLVVEAVNPNAIAVTIGTMDVNLFAKSAHVREGGDDGEGNDKWWKLQSSEEQFGNNGHKSKGLSTIGSNHLSRTLFPKSEYRRSRWSQLHINDNVDEGTDPPEDLPPENDKETMLLGRIYSFDSVLTFDGTPFRRFPTNSTGELRLAKPGNKTEEGGSERWERVLLHPFELIVRGVLKYQLPLSGKTRTAPISGSVLIHPDSTVA